MREKIARSLYEKASAERDGFIDERKLDARKSWPWDKLSKRNIDYWKGVASQTLTLISEEIEKAENPIALHHKNAVFETDYHRGKYLGFEDFRKKVLALLK